MIRSRVVRLLTVSLAWPLVWSGCATTKTAPMPTLPETPPEYVKAPHPEGLNLGDLMAIFTDRDAPAPDALKECDTEWNKLRAATQSREELAQGAREFVKLDPVRYHWCFYSKLMQMEEGLKSDAYLDERQKRVIDSYLFVGPMARAFMDEYHDSRYLRWAIARYRRLSEHVFYRRVELSSQMASELGNAENPFGLMRPAPDGREGVLHKYGLLKQDVEHGPAMIDPLMSAQGEVVPPSEVSPATGPAVDAQRIATEAALRGENPPGAPAEATAGAPKELTVEVDRAPAGNLLKVPPAGETMPAIEPPPTAAEPTVPAEPAKPEAPANKL